MLNTIFEKMHFHPTYIKYVQTYWIRVQNFFLVRKSKTRFRIGHTNLTRSHLITENEPHKCKHCILSADHLHKL